MTQETQSVPELHTVVVYDNGKEIFDRYTVYTPDGSVFGMSEFGICFNQYLGERREIPEGEHLGKKLDGIPESIREAVIYRMTN